MAKKSKDKKDNKHDGGGCGQTIGCLILIVAIASVVFYFIVRPELEERGITLDSLKNQTLDLKDKIKDKVISTRETIDQAGDKLQDAGDKVQEAKEDVQDKIQNLQDSGERIKEKIPEAPAQLYEE